MPKTRRFATVIAAALATFAATYASAAPNYTCSYPASAISSYDMDGDGVLTRDDVSCLAEVAVWDMGNSRGGPPSCLAVPLATADLDGNGSVTIIDVLREGRAVDYFGECATYGDLNGDGLTVVSDLQCMNLTLTWAMGPAGQPPPACLSSIEAADLNCDGDITVVDYQLAGYVVIQGQLNSQIDADANGVHDACE